MKKIEEILRKHSKAKLIGVVYDTNRSIIDECDFPAVASEIEAEIFFKSERDAIEWVTKNIPFAIKPKSKRAKYQFIFPFASNDAFVQVTDYLGKQLYERQTEINKQKTDSLI